MIVKKTSDRNVEHAEITAVIEAETTAFLKRDIDALCRCWVQEPYLKHTTILPYAGMVQVNGIDGLRDHFIAHFRNEPVLDIKPEEIRRREWNIVVRDSMAWVTFEQFATSRDATHMSGLQMHTRILEKVRGRWKLVSSTGILSKLDFYDCPKVQVDGSERVIQANEESRKVVNAHPVLKMSGGKLTAKTRADATRLRHAIQEAQLDIKGGNARLPVPLIFGEESGADHPLCWIAILDMKIVVLLDDIRLIETTIESAAKLYGLTATQMRVAEEIAKGKDLNSIANTLKVSTNTVRTHVKRMFERVGVNSQKALMKRLLSAQVPSVGLHY